MVGAEDALVAVTRMLVQLDRRRHLARRMVSGAEVAARRDRVQVVRAEDPLPVREHLLVMGGRVLEPAFGQVGVGQFLPGGHRVRMAGALDPFPVVQRSAVERDRVGQTARGPVGSREFLVRADRVGVVGTQDPVVVAYRPVQHGGGLTRLVGGHQGPAEVAPGGDGAGMVRAPCRDPVSQHPLEPGHGLSGLASREVRIRQPLVDRLGVRVAWPEAGLAGRGELAPVPHGRVRQPGLAQALPGAHEERVAAAGQQQVPGLLLQAGGAGPEHRAEPGWLGDGPHLGQRVGRGAHRAVTHGVRHDRADGRLDHRAHPHYGRGRGPVEGQQRRPLQDRQGVPGQLAGGRGRAVRGEVGTRGGGAEHGGGHSVPVQHGRQGQHRLGRAPGGQPVGLLDGEQPADRGGGWLASRGRGQLVLAGREVALVIPAGQ